MTSIKAAIAVTTAVLVAAAIAVFVVAGGNGTPDSVRTTGSGSDRAAPSSTGAAPESGSGTPSAEVAAPGSEGPTPAGDGSAAPQTSAQRAADLVQAISGQLQQAVTSGGKPRALSPPEVEALLRSELQRLGINQP